MNGKILKISSNDLYGNVDDRLVAVFAIFNHVKYMNKYAIFAFQGEYNKKKLYCGSVHLKENSIVVFTIKPEEVDKYIIPFTNSYLSNKVDTSEYQIMDISKYQKIELISYNEIDNNNLELLDSISIKKEEAVIKKVEEKSSLLGNIILSILFVILVAAITYICLDPSVLKPKLKKLDCTMENGYNSKLRLNYKSTILVQFDKKDEFKIMHKIDTYKFSSLDKYNEFKDNKNEEKLNIKDPIYKYDDEKMELTINYSVNLYTYEYEKALDSLTKEGYSCIEGIYNE